MIVLDGVGAPGAAPALGRACRVVFDAGRPTLDADTLAWLAERIRQEEGEIQLVLVVEEASVALWMPLPYDALLAGVVAERPLTRPLPSEPPIPVVSGVAEARHTIEEGHLLLVDPPRNRVLVEPSAEEVLRVERARKPRFLVGAPHAPAQTRGGVAIPVWGLVRTSDDVRAAIAAGADGLLFPEPADPDVLDAAAAAVGGGDLAVCGAPADALRLAGRARVRFLTDPIPAPPLRDVWRTLADPDAPAGPDPLLLARLAPDTDPERAAGYDEALAPVDVLPLPLLDLPPLRVLIADPDDARRAVTAGAVGVVCPPDRIPDVKDAIRETD